MSGLSHTWAVVRYRRSQSVALVLVSALVTTCALFAPLFVRTLELGCCARPSSSGTSPTPPS